MTAIELAISLITLLVLFVVALAMLRRAVQTPPSTSTGGARNRDGTFAHTCANCGDQTLIGPETLHALSASEKALVVRERHDVVGKNLMEYVCRTCDASHCFVISASAVEYLGANFYEGQHARARCGECQRALAGPPWSPGEFDGKVDSAPGPLGNYGLTCTHCGAVCCVSCCTSVTRRRTKDGTLLCPRCFRGPQENFFHP